MINTKSTPAAISKWKASDSVRYCYENLFKKTRNSENSYMYCIIKHVWPIKLENIPDIWISYAISISEIILNPEIKNIQVSENEVKLKISKNSKKLVSFWSFAIFFI
jgi:hypothetical protein